MFDPFNDNLPTDNSNNEEETVTVTEVSQDPTPVTVETPKAQASSGDENYTTLILKGGTSYGAPSVSIRGANIQDLYEHYERDREYLKKLLHMSSEDGAAYGSLADQHVNRIQSAEKKQGGQQSAPQAQQKQPGKPQGATQAPNGETHSCYCGLPMKFLSGTSKKTQQPYAFFACPQPQGQQCVNGNGKPYTINYKLD
ncbi:hypothetical protein [Actinopolyspora erythraea]|uniref:hypothetical protein n=1 Tax=Actinopolyspora erythraea TaxID=414996 RepID=UPI00178CA484|nr:hypothetical protein [Actinopolyspora erythraea]